MKLHGLVPNFYIHVAVSDLYIPTEYRTVKRQIKEQSEAIIKYFQRLKESTVEGQNKEPSEPRT
jgi:hypothetical protein